MKKVYTAKDIAELVAAGGDVTSIPDSAVITPSGRDAIRDALKKGRNGKSAVATSAASKPAEPIVPDYEFHWTPGTDPKTPEAIQAFFNSPEIKVLKERMCDMGRRIWARSFCDGNGGNITIRVGDNLVLCTPTLISKGYINPEDICLVDMDGKQVAGTRKRTSECNTHLAIMKATPEAKSCVHAHPIYATAFAVCGMVPPTCLIPEPEVFLGQIGLAPYETPGSPEMAATVGKLAPDHQSILMENHGVIVWGKDVEDAYWKMENTESYCQTVYVASQLGGMKTYGPQKLKDLMNIRTSLGMPEKRADWKECELCDNAEFRPGVVCQLDTGVIQPQNFKPEGKDETEALVQKVTDMIMKQLGS
ncbi:MAG: class II aldolase/adducin family protein [Verrucomicrobiota bacterium JB024]|nr:class II aldolase/adducin family protein [Verrucomicrobiota bacterium JB024]